MHTFLVALALAGCSSQVVGGRPCSVQNDMCPAGERCVAVASGAYCQPAMADAGATATDAAADNCFGGGLLGKLCFTALPTGAASLGQAIDTATVGGGSCTEIRAQSGGPSLCVIAADTIALPATVRATGPNPLVLVAARTITIAGTLDVASHVGATGAGARSTCGAAGIDGALSNSVDGGGGGGAGGSFGGAGGPGGDGRQGAAHGTPVAASPPATLLVGGCPGGRGGAGNGGGGEGAGGAGGGAVYLVAGTSITIGGAIDASGAGGAGGTDGLNNSGGAGGGGSGGMIGLDAPAISVTGQLFANGGGGGGGGGNDIGRSGQPGGESSGATSTALGGTGGQGGGGAGGTGAINTATGGTGGKGSSQYCAGGGGGGGVGVIRVYGPAPSSIGGTSSPPPS